MITNSSYLLDISPFVVCDLGARRNIVHPWDILDNINKVITHGFEPDPEEANKLKKISN